MDTPVPLVTGLTAEGRQLHRAAMVQRQKNLELMLNYRIEHMTTATAVAYLADCVKLTTNYLDPTNAAQDLARARARYEVVTGRAAPTR